VSTDVFRQGGVQSGDSDKARRAIAAFRKLQPTLSAYARALTGKPAIKVVMSADGGKTDAKSIYYRPPLALGDDTRHQRELCMKRGDDLSQLCPACRVREQVLITIYHEIGHIAYDSFERTSKQVQADAVNRAVREVGTKYAKMVSHKIDNAPEHIKNSYIGLSGLISPFLPAIVNAIEDARINGSVMKARPGTRLMFEAEATRVFTEGVEQTSPTGELTTVQWIDYPLNMQAAVGLYLKAAGYDYTGWLRDEVIEALADPEVTAALRGMATLRSVTGVYEMSFPILAAMRRHGFFKSDTDPVDEDEQDDPPPFEDDSKEESNDDGADGSDGSDSDDGDDESAGSQASEGADSDSGEPDGSDDSDGGDAQDGESGDSGDPDADTDGDAADDGETGAPSESDGSEDLGDAGQEAGSQGYDQDGEGEGASDGQGDAAEEGPAGESEGGAGYAGDRADEESAGGGDGDSEQAGDDDAGSPEPGDDSGAGDGDDAGDRADDGRTGDGDGADGGADDQPQDPDGGQGEGQGAGDLGEPDDGPDRNGEVDHGHVRDEETDGGEHDLGDGEGMDAGEQDGGGQPDGPDTSGQDADVEVPEGQLVPAGVGEAGQVPAEAEVATGQDPAVDDGPSEGLEGDEGALLADDEEERHDQGLPSDAGEPLDSGEDTEGTTVNKVSSFDELDMGTPEQARDAVHDVAHPEDRPEIIDELFSGPDGDDELDRAIAQDGYFETPSGNIFGVKEHHYDDQSEDSHAWKRRKSAWGYTNRQIGIEGEFDPDESILGPALMRMRVAFADNRRAKDEHNRKSGKVDGRVLGKRAHFGDERIFKRRTVPGKKDYFVIIGIDISGSTVGENIVLAKRAAMAQAELLNRSGVKFAVYCHTGSWHSKPGDRDAGFDVDIYHIKDPDEAWTDATRTRLRDIGPSLVNLDGHTIEYYRKILDKRTETNRIIMYYTDGKMPAENHNEELEILIREIRVCKQKGYTLMGVGINTDSPVEHGLDTAMVTGDEDIVKVVKHIERRLLNT
jgi:hypothetical protein